MKMQELSRRYEATKADTDAKRAELHARQAAWLAEHPEPGLGESEITPEWNAWLEASVEADSKAEIEIGYRAAWKAQIEAEEALIKRLAIEVGPTLALAGTDGREVARMFAQHTHLAIRGRLIDMATRYAVGR